MRALAVAAFALLAACTRANNPCAGQAEMCLAVEVNGSVPTIDEIVVSVTAPSGRLNGRALGVPAEIDLPVQFAALLPAGTAGALLVELLGRRNGAPLAYGLGVVTVPPSGQRLSVRMSRIDGDGGADLGGFELPDLTGFAEDLAGQDLAGRDLAQPIVDLAARDLANVSCGAGCTLGSFSTASELTIAPPRTAYVLARTSTRVYLVGGQEGTGNMPTATVAVATINGDGTLGPFANSAIALGTARQLVAGTTAGGWLYVVGGEGPGTFGTEILTSIERAPINADGTLGAFTAAGSSLTTARAAHQVVAMGGFLYAIGGFSGDLFSSTPTASIERATINADGSLGAFSAAGSLPAAKASAGMLVTVSAVYLVGGNDAAGSVDTVERAPIVAGGLGGFADSGLRLRTRRGGLAMLAVGGQAFAIGGGFAIPDAGTGVMFPRALESASLDGAGTLGSFSTSTLQLSKGRGGHGVVALGAAAYVIGGFDGTVDLDSVERAPLQ